MRSIYRRPSSENLVRSDIDPGRSWTIYSSVGRTSRFGLGINHNNAPPLSLPPGKLNIPKKTKLFVDQALRERESAVEMHRTFQKDLFKLRLTTARAFSQCIRTSLNPLSSSLDDPLKLAAKVCTVLT